MKKYPLIGNYAPLYTLSPGYDKHLSPGVLGRLHHNLWRPMQVDMRYSWGSPTRDYGSLIYQTYVPIAYFNIILESL